MSGLGSEDGSLDLCMLLTGGKGDGRTLFTVFNKTYKRVDYQSSEYAAKR
jgi:hypothetical protein